MTQEELVNKLKKVSIKGQWINPCIHTFKSSDEKYEFEHRYGE